MGVAWGWYDMMGNGKWEEFLAGKGGIDKEGVRVGVFID